MRDALWIVAVIIAVAVVAPPASAQGFMPWTEVVLMADGDQDGNLSMDEVKAFKATDHFAGFQPFMVDHYNDMDLNKDGTVSMAEIKMFSKNQMNVSDDALSQIFYKSAGFMPRAQ